jgi:hypothetical protein
MAYKPLPLKNPFEAAGGVYHDLLKEAKDDKKKWQSAAFVSLGFVVCCIGILVYAVSMRKTVPVLVAVAQWGGGLVPGGSEGFLQYAGAGNGYPISDTGILSPASAVSPATAIFSTAILQKEEEINIHKWHYQDENKAVLHTAIVLFLRIFFNLVKAGPSRIKTAISFPATILFYHRL